MIALSFSLNWDKQMGHFVTRTPSSESFSFTLPWGVVRRESTEMSPGRTVASAPGVAAGFFPGPRKEVIWEKP